MPIAPHARLIAFLFMMISVSLPTAGQENYPTHYFKDPIDFRLLLSGTFGELRSNHFHSGIDIKTNGNKGVKVYAVADGYISRINVSTYGFGKALYINHPNGYTSVYAHLDYFTGETHKYVIGEHYQRESFEMTLYPEPGALPVKKGDVIAYSGNSGSSAGPHLHFEIRNTADQVPINPLLFGFEVKDYYRPHISRIKIYAEGSNSLVNGENSDLSLDVEGWGKEHKLVLDRVTTISGSIGFGIQCYDRQNDTPNKNGIYSLKVFFDDEEVSSTRMELFPFSDSRYINSLIDYPEFVASGIRYQRTEIDPGNMLKIYKGTMNNGLVYVDDTLSHKIRMELTDVPGNLSVLEFQVQGQNAIKEIRKPLPSEGDKNSMMFKYDILNRFETEGFILDAPVGAFYRSFDFVLEIAGACEACLAPVYHVHNKYTPIHDPVTLAIKPVNLDRDLFEKALLIVIDEDTPDLVSAGGEYSVEDGYVQARIRSFGRYSVAIDTVPPTISALNPASSKSLEKGDALKFRIKDELSGIRSYRGTINGKWILMEYDAKNDLLFYYVDDHLQKGSNSFRLEVVDMKENSQVYEANLILQ